VSLAELGTKIGKIGISILKSHYSTSDEAPAVLLAYYGAVGVLNNQIQECEYMHSRGRDIAMQTGNLYMASLNLIAMISRALQGGTNLNTLLQLIELQLKKAQNAEVEIAVQLKNSGNMAIDIPCLLIFQQIVTGLMNGKSNSDSQSHGLMMLDVLYQGRLLHSVVFGDAKEALQSANKIQTRSLFGILFRAFYSGLASISMYRENGSSDLEDVRSSLSKLEHASAYNEWNFSNKVWLLRAELASLDGNDNEAQKSYDAAILAARTSKFIHEEVSKHFWSLTCLLYNASHQATSDLL
jgi:hypothetical protein